MSSPKSRLTDQEKKNNHIASEQKRRQAIREGFDRLATIVPGMEGQGRSEAIVLDATVQYMTNALQQRQMMLAKAKEMGIDTKEFEIPGLENPLDVDQLIAMSERASRLKAATLRRSYHSLALAQDVAANGGQKDTQHDTQSNNLNTGEKNAQTDAQHAALPVSEGGSHMIAPHDIVDVAGDAAQVVARKNTFLVAGNAAHNVAHNNALDSVGGVAQSVAQDAALSGDQSATLKVDEDIMRDAAMDPDQPRMQLFALGAHLEAGQGTQKCQNGADLNDVHEPQDDHSDSNVRDAQMQQHSHNSLESLFGTPKSSRRGCGRTGQDEQNKQNEQKEQNAQNARLVRITQDAQKAQNDRNAQDGLVSRHDQNPENTQKAPTAQESMKSLEIPTPRNSLSGRRTQYDESDMFAQYAQDHQATGHAKNERYTQGARSGLTVQDPQYELDIQKPQTARHRQASEFGQYYQNHGQYGQTHRQYGQNHGQYNQNYSQYGEYTQNAYDSPIEGYEMYGPYGLHDEHRQHGKHGQSSRYDRNGQWPY